MAAPLLCFFPFMLTAFDAALDTASLVSFLIEPCSCLRVSGSSNIPSASSFLDVGSCIEFHQQSR